MAAQTQNDLLELVRQQINMDEDDFSEIEDLIGGYLDDGFYALMRKRKNGVLTGVTPLAEYSEIPLPAWSRSAVADYATYLYYRNGNALKQQRGQEYLARFQQTEALLPTETAEAALAANGGKYGIKNLYGA